MSREKVKDEIIAEVVEHIRELICFWESTNKNSLDKLNGLAFSILAALDGSADALPSFIIAPRPHPEDKQFNIKKGINYYPENHLLDEVIKADIAGELHENFYRVREGSVDNIVKKGNRRLEELHKQLLKK
ncbi:hypothetical protein AZ66_29255 [Paenibacillus sp. E194]|uniref:hypothetical protein n=1 Tax=Paenibacillus sp. E194 TaxID=1458845 RepID=UPI0005C9866C|nr:hypothetical protein [Paenibacillus sp. E194]KJB84717.1 hypothetical protein AZ66_29255 [Paenibacillus sp. E194]